MRNFVFMVAAAIIGFTACEKSIPEENINGTLTPQPQVGLTTGTDKLLLEISEIICKLSDDTIVKRSIMNGIKDNLYFGRDEELRLIDVLFPKNSKLIRNPKSVLHFTEILRPYFGVKENSELKENLDNPIVRYIVDNDINIYFPYSREMFGETPVVVAVQQFDEENEKNNTFPTFHKRNGGIERNAIEVTDALSEKIPLWIITRNTTPYDDLPNFLNGDRVKKGVFFTTRELMEFGKVPTYGEFNNPNKVYTLHIGNVICSNAGFDFGGGIELMFKFITAKRNGQDFTQQTYTAVRFDFTRKECRNRVERNTTNILVDDWQIDNEYGGIEVYEEDPGNRVTKSIPITLKIGNYVDFSTSIPIGRYDDHIYNSSIGRSIYFSTYRSDHYNGFTADGWPRRGAGGHVLFSLKHTISNRVY